MESISYTTNTLPTILFTPINREYTRSITFHFIALLFYLACKKEDMSTYQVLSIKRNRKYSCIKWYFGAIFIRNEISFFFQGEEELISEFYASGKWKTVNTVLAPA